MLIILLCLPALPFLFLLGLIHNLMYRLFTGREYYGGSGDIGVMFMIGAPIGFVAWCFIIHQMVKHIRIV